MTDVFDQRSDTLPRFVYGIQCGDFIKIGVATDINRRLETMRLYNPHPCNLIFRRKTVCAYRCEKKMHEILSAKSVGREWFAATLEEVRAAAVIGISDASKAFRKQKRFDIKWEREMRILANSCTASTADTEQHEKPLQNGHNLT